MNPHEGMEIGGRVRLRRPLGKGGMGSVWIGEHLTLQTQVAVKFIFPDLARDPTCLARFSREATSAAGLKHPNVVQIFDHGITEDGLPFIVMELLEGQSLRQRLERGRLDLRETEGIIGQLCSAVARVHAQGVVHRDIKPDNIFLIDVDGRPFVKLLDFGIAKRQEDGIENITVTGSMIGTPYYMSPEQACGDKDIDHRSDVWSIAVVAYQCLTGVVPFEGKSAPALLLAIDRASFVPVSERESSLPPVLDAFFAQGLARDPELRFASVADMREALEATRELVYGGGLTIKHAAPARRGWALPAVAALLLIAAAGLWWGARRGEPPLTTHIGEVTPPDMALSLDASAPAIIDAGEAPLVVDAATQPDATPSPKVKLKAEPKNKPKATPKKAAPTPKKAAPTPKKAAPTPKKAAPTSEAKPGADEEYFGF